MHSSSLAFSVLRAATWTYVGSLIAIGSIALFELCAGLVHMAFQVGATVLQQAGG